MDTEEEYREWNNNESMLSANTRLLVAIAGAVSLNCKSCLETLVPRALRYGIVPEEIAEVVSIVKEVRDNVTALTHDLVTRLLGWEVMQEPGQTCCGPDGKCLAEPASPPDTK